MHMQKSFCVDKNKINAVVILKILLKMVHITITRVLLAHSLHLHL